MEDVLFGQILLDFQLITETDLEQCIEQQQQSDMPKRLGEMLVGRGLLDERTLASILSVQRQKLGAVQTTPEPTEAEIEARLATADATEFLALIKTLGASDAFLSSQKVPMIRLHGNLVELPAEPMSFERCRDMLFALLTPEQIDSYYEKKYLDLRLQIDDVGRFRVNIFRHFGGIGAVFRTLADSVMPFEQLGLPDIAHGFTRLKGGLVLISGPAGSGKSTTMTALIDQINKQQKVHVITLEDPIETVLRSDAALITQREIDTHTDSYADALRAALREDPDVLVVGEMRDPETVATALTAAETGHLVLGTLHTRTAFSTIIRVIDQFPAEKRAHVRTMLAGVLRGVICQELVPQIDGNGRSLAAEVMVVNSAISNLIREDRVWQIPMVMQMSSSAGMCLMDDSLSRLVRQRKITVEEAMTRATDESKLVAAS